jgi:hypothetical protein
MGAKGGNMRAEFVVYLVAVGVGLIAACLVRRLPPSALLAMSLASAPVVGVALQLTLTGDG